ncbi:hypothetical protein ACFPL7_10100 [Dongia soli]|uniref:Uncharacterized protein n=1 Tax=Dongia soli TaxID=600628 RepID=A0ABU5EAW8_9PROT|nr:hypothetical protein [Dongia soli]MDY0883301.1 hypothetical protein [Dongia soli]
MALIADGEAPQDVYKVLGTSEGVDRAFKKLDQIKPDCACGGPPARNRRNYWRMERSS